MPSDLPIISNPLVVSLDSAGHRSFNPTNENIQRQRRNAYYTLRYISLSLFLGQHLLKQLQRFIAHMQNIKM